LGKIHKEKRDLEMKLSEEIQQNEEIISMLENERGQFTSTFQQKLKSLRYDKKRLKAKITIEEMALIDTL
jgi:predicted nuclease with TOPRIM domain